MVSVTQQSASEQVNAERARFVARGVSTPKLVVERAAGAHVTDVDGRTFLDFAGGIACQNTGHGFAPVVAAIHEQADRFLHQCFMVGTYEPYVEVCRRLADLSPCGAGEQRSVLVNSGAEAVENAVKIARVATGRPAVVVFDNAFHGRTLLTMTMTSKVKPYKARFRAVRARGLPAPAPYPYRGITSDDAIAALEHLFKGDVDPSPSRASCSSRYRARAASSRCRPIFPAGCSSCAHARDPLRRRRDPVRHGAHREAVGDRALRGVEPDLLVSGKSLGGGLPLAGVTGRAELMDAVPPGGLGGTFGGNPLSCAAAIAVLDAVAEPALLACATRLGEHAARPAR